MPNTDTATGRAGAAQIPYREQAGGLECRSCGARLEIEPRQRTGRCLYCGSPQVIERPPSADRPNPTFAIGFVVTPERALETARRWVKARLFAPQAFRRARVEDIRGIYLPAYLYSAAAYSDYTASIGENYTETYTTTDSKGRRVTRTRTRTEWRSLRGRHAMYVSDQVVTASSGLPNDELEAVEPFDLRALKRFGPKLVSGWTAEEPSLAPRECAHMAREEAMRQVSARLSRFMPGDKHRELRHDTRFENEDLRLTLLPLWVLPVRYRHDAAVVRLLVNGQTGKLAGRPPVSWVKVTAAVLLGLCLLAGIVLAVMGSV